MSWLQIAKKAGKAVGIDLSIKAVDDYLDDLSDDFADWATQGILDIFGHKKKGSKGKKAKQNPKKQKSFSKGNKSNKDIANYKKQRQIYKKKKKLDKLRDLDGSKESSQVNISVADSPLIEAINNLTKEVRRNGDNITFALNSISSDLEGIDDTLEESSTTLKHIADYVEELEYLDHLEDLENIKDYTKLLEELKNLKNITNYSDQLNYLSKIESAIKSIEATDIEPIKNALVGDSNESILSKLNFEDYSTQLNNLSPIKESLKNMNLSELENLSKLEKLVYLDNLKNIDLSKLDNLDYLKLFDNLNTKTNQGQKIVDFWKEVKEFFSFMNKPSADKESPRQLMTNYWLENSITFQKINSIKVNSSILSGMTYNRASTQSSIFSKVKNLFNFKF